MIRHKTEHCGCAWGQGGMALEPQTISADAIEDDSELRDITQRCRTNPMLAGAAMRLSSVLVITNALRLRSVKLDRVQSNFRQRSKFVCGYSVESTLHRTSMGWKPRGF